MTTCRAPVPLALLVLASTVLGQTIPAAAAPQPAPASQPSTQPAVLPGVRRILFLGDSITYAGGYIDYVEAHLLTRLPDRRFELLDLGIPSETTSGLSEPGHPFPRPDVHERLDRTMKALAAADWRPDLVVACYGMNDGIYFALNDHRFAAYRDGIRRLVERVKADGISITLMTPTPFDPRPSRAKAKTRPAETRPAFGLPYERYDDVLAAYADWLRSQRAAAGWDVIDLHGPMTDAELTARQADPAFALAGDGVHPGPLGHWLMARQVLRHWRLRPADEFPGPVPNYKGGPPITPEGERDLALLKLLGQRRKILSDAWLNHIGHKRPGMSKGLPLDEAKKNAAELDAEIRRLAAAATATPAQARD